jgi:hypothetical protein
MVVMSGDDGLGFAPAFKPEDALVHIRRALRDLKLTERGKAFELRGKGVIELDLDTAARAIQARIARKLALTPQWDRVTIDSAAQQRKFIDDIRRRLARWEQDE